MKEALRQDIAEELLNSKARINDSGIPRAGRQGHSSQEIFPSPSLDTLSYSKGNG